MSLRAAARSSTKILGPWRHCRPLVRATKQNELSTHTPPDLPRHRVHIREVPGPKGPPSDYDREVPRDIVAVDNEVLSYD
jgi:hypothetical protein